MRLAWALEQLPAAQHEVVIVHNFQRQSLADIAARLGRTKPAVVGLLHRGLTRLREPIVADQP